MEVPTAKYATLLPLISGYNIVHQSKYIVYLSTQYNDFTHQRYSYILWETDVSKPVFQDTRAI